MCSIYNLVTILLNPDQSKLNIKNIFPRPNAGPGIWLAFLLPIAVLIGVVQYPTASYLYRHIAVVSVGLLLTTAEFVVKARHRSNKPALDISAVHIIHFLPCAIIPAFILFLSNNSVMQSIFLGISSTYPYILGIVPVLQHCPQCFTFGEASVILQAIILFLYAALRNFYDGWYTLLHHNDCINTSTIILQIGWIGIGTISSFVYCFPKLRATLLFYGLSAVILVGVVVPMLHVFLQASPVLWILQLLADDWPMVVYWALCSALAVVAIRGQINGGQKASTVVRKCFHVLAVAVFIPGLIYKQCLLYLASGIVMALFIALELVRVLALPPWGSGLQDGFSMFVDDKDQGGLSLTPLYLLGGCALPLWLHPVPSLDRLLPLSSGVLSVGIGDTVASVCGTKLGRHYWPGGSKTVEGTLGCVSSQLATVSLMIYFGFIEGSSSVWLRSIVGIASISLIEAKTDQVDNLVLPLVMYILLV